MRILRLRLVNYRGLQEAEIPFQPNGITVVEGPNEAGKTSLAEAIRILFEFLDSSRNRLVEAIKPVHRDAGTEIELQVETGPYSFTYFKRFHKKPETSLQVTSPKHENLTGREAHERAEAILRETIDISLWRALQIEQGVEIRQADLSTQISLSAALDKAAGGRSIDPREESIFEKVKEEYGRYHTERGNEKKELQEARQAEEVAKADVSRLQQQLQDLENDINRAAILQIDLARLEKMEQELQEMVFQNEKDLQDIQSLETQLQAARLKSESQQKSEEAARLENETRQSLIGALVETLKAQTELGEASGLSASALQQAEEGLAMAHSTAAHAEGLRKEAEAQLILRRADLDYFNDKLHLEQMKERKERIDKAREKAALAEQLLAKIRVDDDQLKKIQEAERALDIARAKLTAGVPSLELKALTNLTLQIGGTPAQFAKNESRTLSVADRLRVMVPNTIDMQIIAGASAEELSRTVDKARVALDKVCKTAGVTDPDEARTEHETRREALRGIENKEQVERENLRDLTYEQLESKVISLGKSIPAYPTERMTQPQLVSDLDSAKRELRQVEVYLGKSTNQSEVARNAFEVTRAVCDQLRGKHQENRIQLDLKATDVKRAEENLLRARAHVPDHELATNLAKAVSDVQFWLGQVKTSDDALQQKGPDRVRALADTAKGSLQTTQKKRKDVQHDRTVVDTRLKVLGEDGLHDKLQIAETRLEHAHREHIAVCRRAAAVKLLFETMKEQREKGRRAYVAPLQDRIERLGRLLFNNTFRVEVNDDLIIANRTLNGITVPFDSLSGGTKEQLSLITRLACAMIVSKNGGAPLILDDALGYTDPERLKLMGALLAKAGQECQVVILTCVPDRYSNIGAASVIRLG